MSDGAGLVVLPVFLAAPFGFRRRGRVAACCLAAGLLLAAVQVPPVARALSVGLLHFTPDWTDLLALAVRPASYALIRRQARCGEATPLPGRPALRRGLALAALAATTAALAATSVLPGSTVLIEPRRSLALGEAEDRRQVLALLGETFHENGLLLEYKNQFGFAGDSLHVSYSLRRDITTGRRPSMPATPATSAASGACAGPDGEATPLPVAPPPGCRFSSAAR